MRIGEFSVTCVINSIKIISPPAPLKKLAHFQIDYEAHKKLSLFLSPTRLHIPKEDGDATPFW